MQSIGDYLSKFKGFLNSKEQSRKIIAQEIQKILGIEIKERLIEVKDGIAYIKESPIIKNTIFFNKKMILDNISRLGVSISDIR